MIKMRSELIINNVSNTCYRLKIAFLISVYNDLYFSITSHKATLIILYNEFSS